ncbi:MAG: hypothetical protein Q4F83_12515 [Eubacteriales bacterium]|nr:hypothetical protein [Eubacteriales bacterium]
MSVKIKVSYQTPQELESILKLLRPAIKSAKIKKGQQGAYKKAYIEIKGTALQDLQSPKGV